MISSSAQISTFYSFQYQLRFPAPAFSSMPYPSSSTNPAVLLPSIMYHGTPLLKSRFFELGDVPALLDVNTNMIQLYPLIDNLSILQLLTLRPLHLTLLLLFNNKSLPSIKRIPARLLIRINPRRVRCLTVSAPPPTAQSQMRRIRGGRTYSTFAASSRAPLYSSPSTNYSSADTASSPPSSQPVAPTLAPLPSSPQCSARPAPPTAEYTPHTSQPDTPESSAHC